MQRILAGPSIGEGPLSRAGQLGHAARDRRELWRSCERLGAIDFDARNAHVHARYADVDLAVEWRADRACMSEEIVDPLRLEVRMFPVAASTGPSCTYPTMSRAGT